MAQASCEFRAQAHQWLRLIESDKATNISIAAKPANVDRSCIRRMIR